MDNHAFAYICSQELQKLQMYTAEILKAEILKAEILKAEILKAEILKAEILKAEILKAEQSQQNLEQVTTYMVLALGESHPINMQFMQLSAERA